MLKSFNITQYINNAPSLTWVSCSTMFAEADSIDSDEWLLDLLAALPPTLEDFTLIIDRNASALGNLFKLKAIYHEILRTFPLLQCLDLPQTLVDETTFEDIQRMAQAETLHLKRIIIRTDSCWSRVVLPDVAFSAKGNQIPKCARMLSAACKQGIGFRDSLLVLDVWKRTQID